MNSIVCGHVLDVLKELPGESIHCCVTSPPYWGLRDYSIPPVTWPDGTVSSLGLEPTPELFISHLVDVFREVKRVLRGDGTFWVNIGDSYAGSGAGGGGNRKGNEHGQHDNMVGKRQPVSKGLKPKDLCLIPERLAIALQEDGWWIRSRIIWAKGSSFGTHNTECPRCGHKHTATYSGSCMPESVRDRPAQSYEHVWMLGKSARYYYDNEAVKEPSVYPDDDRKARSNSSQKRMPTELIGGVRPGSSTYPTRNLRSVWLINPQPLKEAHFATFPPDLVEPMIKAGTSERGCCPECGSPWKRIVENELIPQYESRHGGFAARGNSNGMVDMSKSWTPGYNKSTTIGWKPTCTCSGLEIIPKQPRKPGKGKLSKEQYEVKLTRYYLKLNEWQYLWSTLEPQYKLVPRVPAIVLDPFMGAGTTGLVAKKLGRHYLGIELNPEYIEIAKKRIQAVQPRLF